MAACSGNQLIFEPATGPGVNINGDHPGVIEIELPINITPDTTEDEILDAINKKVDEGIDRGDYDDFTFRMFSISRTPVLIWGPDENDDEDTGTAAWAYVGREQSWYNDDYILKPMVR